jgi:hypothetical protein
VQADLNNYYNSLNPGRVQVLGIDMYNGTEAQVRSYRTQTGATYPLLLQGASSTGGNMNTLYGPFDNYLVIGVDGVVKYHSANIHPHGDRYYLNEIRAIVNQELTTGVGVPDGGGFLPGFVVAASPNPFSNATVVEFVNPMQESVPARVTAHDPRGRLVATIWSGTAEPGRKTLRWNGVGRAGHRLAAGGYFVRVQLGTHALTRRVTLLP